MCVCLRSSLSGRQHFYCCEKSYREGEPCVCGAEARWETKGATNQTSGSCGGTQTDNKAIRDVLQKQRAADHTDRMESEWCSETTAMCFLAPPGSLAPPFRAQALFHFIPLPFFFSSDGAAQFPPWLTAEVDPAGSQRTLPEFILKIL